MASKSEAAETAAVPRPVLGLFDRPFWDSVAARRMSLQRCDDCGGFWYPPGPACPNCLSEAVSWVPVSGRATILSWVVFHRQYLPAYKPPYNVIAVRLDEGPVMVSNLLGREPDGNWIGHRVSLVYDETAGDLVLPRFVLCDKSLAALGSDDA